MQGWLPSQEKIAYSHQQDQEFSTLNVGTLWLLTYQAFALGFKIASSRDPMSNPELGPFPGPQVRLGAAEHGRRIREGRHPGLEHRHHHSRQKFALRPGDAFFSTIHEGRDTHAACGLFVPLKQIEKSLQKGWADALCHKGFSLGSVNSNAHLASQQKLFLLW